MNELALFAGAGGGILGGKLLGWKTVCAVERDAYASQVLAQRQNDGVLHPFPIWSDIESFDGSRWRGIIDVVSGGFPCQDISPANANGKGLDGKKSGLWREMFRIIQEVQPKRVLIENSKHLRTKGLNVILQDLARIGYNAAWGVLSASTLGANHERGRMWIVASNTNSPQCERGGVSCGVCQEDSHTSRCSWWEDQPGVPGVDDGVAYRVDRLKAGGNGQVPIVAATAYRELERRLYL